LLLPGYKLLSTGLSLLCTVELLSTDVFLEDGIRAKIILVNYTTDFTTLANFGPFLGWNCLYHLCCPTLWPTNQSIVLFCLSSSSRFDPTLLLWFSMNQTVQNETVEPIHK